MNFDCGIQKRMFSKNIKDFVEYFYGKTVDNLENTAVHFNLTT
jgi:hypothetical protein